MALVANYTLISRLKLSNFRNYKSREFNFENKIIAIFGNNGVGKTNILEAISLLGKGQGLKNAEFEEMISNNTFDERFSIYCDLKNHPQIENIGTSYTKKQNKRIFQVNNKILNSHSKNRIFPAIIWLNPQMDNLFCSSKALRRKFLDKIVSDIDLNHHNRINLYNQSTRERINLLQHYQNQQKNWLEIVERKIAELGTAIATARNDAINYLNQVILENNYYFDKAHLQINGFVEELARQYRSIEVEEKFIQKLTENRDIDCKSRRTNFGVHKSDFNAILLDKEMEAKFCSTGEQKSILISLTFARVKILSLLNLPSAILILDEIVSHLDEKKRLNLLEEISNLNCQSFITATHKSFFSDLHLFKQKNAQLLEIS